MPHVFVLGVVGFTVDLEGNIVRLGVVDLFLTGLDAPLTPRGDDGHIGGKVLNGQLETNLIVALAGAAVADSVGAFLESDLHKALGNAGTGVRGAEKIIFVNGARLHGGDDIIVNIFVGEIENVKLGSAGLESFFFQTFELVRLTYVAGYGDDLAVVVVFFEPRDDDGGIKTARIGENDFFDVCF